MSERESDSERERELCLCVCVCLCGRNVCVCVCVCLFFIYVFSSPIFLCTLIFFLQVCVREPTRIVPYKSALNCADQLWHLMALNYG